MKGITLLLLISLNVSAGDYELDLNYTQVKHHWSTGGYDTANFNRDMVGIGLTKWWSGFGVRAAYQKGGDSQTATGFYEGWTLGMESITSLEFIYRYNINDKFKVYCGIGVNSIPYPIYDPQGVLVKDDRDDDEGYFCGVTYMPEDLGVSLRKTVYGEIENKDINLKEWTKGISFQVIYKF